MVARNVAPNPAGRGGSTSRQPGGHPTSRAGDGACRDAGRVARPASLVEGNQPAANGPRWDGMGFPCGSSHRGPGRHVRGWATRTTGPHWQQCRPRSAGPAAGRARYRDAV